MFKIPIKRVCKMVGSDFSQAEPRLLAWYSQDEQMIGAYRNKKDLYSTVAATVFNNSYEDNLEFYPDGSMNYEGKERRTFCKSVILGIMYGRGAASIAEQVGKTVEESQQIIDQFYGGFPKVKEWVDNTQKSCKEKGYVETLWHRRRRLPDIQLPPYEVKSLNPGEIGFNPLIGSTGKFAATIPAVDKYKQLLSKPVSKKDFDNLKLKAAADHVELLNNMGYIAQAERQCVNARVQGGSADITKRAMIKIYNDSIMREYGFKILLCIHDEIIGECPEEFAEKAAKRLSELMLDAPKPECQLEFKCDADIFDQWYATEYATLIRADYEAVGRDFEKLREMHSESTEEFLRTAISGEQ